MIAIDTLVMSLPGLTPEQASTLAQNVAENLSYVLPGFRQDLELNEIQVKLQEERLHQPHLLAGYITDQIVQSIHFSISNKY